MTFNCLVKAGKPHPQIRWFKRGAEKEESKETIEQDLLTLSSVTKEDAGIYVCEADNGFGTGPSQDEVKLEVHCELIGLDISA